jgi:type IV pilus assembly protein PilA
MQKKQKGFTLIEILLVIGIIAVLATVVIVALDPAKRFADARDSRRLSDIQSILSAVQQYIVDNEGALPNGLDTEQRQIGTAAGGCSLSASHCSVNPDYCLDLTTPLARYLKSLPYDPSNGSSSVTHYAIAVDTNNIVTVTACDSTDATIAAVSR